MIMFSPAALGSKMRHIAFGGVVSATLINKHFANLSRIVLDPRYRGAGIAGDFMRAACGMAGRRYIELVTSMGNISRFWVKAGFVDYGNTAALLGSNRPHHFSEGMATKVINRKAATLAQSMLSVMRYYLLDTAKVYGGIAKGR